MTEYEKLFVLSLRRVARLFLGMHDKFETTSDNCKYFGQQASDLILEGLLSDRPFMVSRFGHSELRAILTYLHIREPKTCLPKVLNYIRGEKVEPWWHEETVKQLTHNAGVFPNRPDIIDKFCSLSLNILQNIDVLGSWLGGEVWLKEELANAKFIRFHDFYHFLHDRPWTAGLADRRVLVIHPFANSILSQYGIRKKIFDGVHTLPDFELFTYKSIQSIAGNKPNFSDWFEALHAMQRDILQYEFDIALIGCGAYGMPLASFIKAVMGKKAIHLGGNLQILFGIRGSRWESDPQFAHLFNKYWTKPSVDETPAGHSSIDNNCYW